MCWVACGRHKIKELTFREGSYKSCPICSLEVENKRIKEALQTLYVELPDKTIREHYFLGIIRQALKGK